MAQHNTIPIVPFAACATLDIGANEKAVDNLNPPSFPGQPLRLFKEAPPPLPSYGAGARKEPPNTRIHDAWSLPKPMPMPWTTGFPSQPIPPPSSANRQTQNLYEYPTSEEDRLRAENEALRKEIAALNEIINQRESKQTL
jgi:hypothetical protein